MIADNKTLKRALCAAIVILLIGGFANAFWEYINPINLLPTELQASWWVTKKIFNLLIESASSAINNSIDIILSSALVFAQITPCVHGSGGPPAACPQYDMRVMDGELNMTLTQDPKIRHINLGFMGFLQQFYILAILFLAAYIIFMSGSPQGRVQAKDMFVRMVVGMVVVSNSPLIFQFLLDITRLVTEGMMSIANENFGQIHRITAFFSKPSYCCTMAGFMFVAGLGAMIAAFRYFLVYIMACFFPLTLFLYFTDVPNPFFSFRGVGTRLLRFTLLLMMIQILQVLFLAAGILLSSEKHPSTEYIIIDLLLVMAAYSGIVLTPLLGMQMMSWVGAIVHLTSSRPSQNMQRFIATWMRTGKIGTAMATSSGQYMVGHTMGHDAGGPGKAENLGYGAVPNRGIFTDGNAPDTDYSHEGPVGPSGYSPASHQMGAAGVMGATGTSPAGASVASSRGAGPAWGNENAPNSVFRGGRSGGGMPLAGSSDSGGGGGGGQDIIGGQPRRSGRGGGSSGRYENSMIERGSEGPDSMVNYQDSSNTPATKSDLSSGQTTAGISKGGMGIIRQGSGTNETSMDNSGSARDVEGEPMNIIDDVEGPPVFNQGGGAPTGMKVGSTGNPLSKSPRLPGSHSNILGRMLPTKKAGPKGSEGGAGHPGQSVNPVKNSGGVAKNGMPLGEKGFDESGKKGVGDDAAERRTKKHATSKENRDRRKAKRDWDKIRRDANRAAERDADLFAKSEYDKARRFAENEDRKARLYGERIVSSALGVDKKKSQEIVGQVGSDRITQISEEAGSKQEFRDYLNDELDLAPLRKENVIGKRIEEFESDLGIGKPKGARIFKRPFAARNSVLSLAGKGRGIKKGGEVKAKADEKTGEGERITQTPPPTPTEAKQYQAPPLPTETPPPLPTETKQYQAPPIPTETPPPLPTETPPPLPTEAKQYQAPPIPTETPPPLPTEAKQYQAPPIPETIIPPLPKEKKTG